MCLVLCVISRLAAVLGAGTPVPAADEEINTGKACMSPIPKPEPGIRADTSSSLDAPSWFECSCALWAPALPPHLRSERELLALLASRAPCLLPQSPLSQSTPEPQRNHENQG